MIGMNYRLGRRNTMRYFNWEKSISNMYNIFKGVSTEELTLI